MPPAATPAEVLPASDTAEPAPATDNKPAQALPPTPPVGKPVTDPALLEEFRKAGAALPAKEQTAPTPTKKAIR
jgi:hypothetical protein